MRDRGHFCDVTRIGVAPVSLPVRGAIHDLSPGLGLPRAQAHSGEGAILVVSPTTTLHALLLRRLAIPILSPVLWMPAATTFRAGPRKFCHPKVGCPARLLPREDAHEHDGTR